MVRFPVVLFDLDGTVIDSGAIILASMRHATREVLGREYGDAELMQAVGGPGLEAQMAAFAPDRVDELIRALRIDRDHLRLESRPSDGLHELGVGVLPAEHLARRVPHRREDDRAGVDDGAVAIEENGGKSHGV